MPSVVETATGGTPALLLVMRELDCRAADEFADDGVARHDVESRGVGFGELLHTKKIEVVTFDIHGTLHS